VKCTLLCRGKERAKEQRRAMWLVTVLKWRGGEAAFYTTKIPGCVCWV